MVDKMKRLGVIFFLSVSNIKTQHYNPNNKEQLTHKL